MEELEIDGKKFVKSRDAAKKTGYTTDYIGQLCREKEINARMVGRSWYVDLDDVVAHKKDKKRSSRSKAREQVKKAIAEEAEKKRTSKKISVKEAHVSYANDDRDLIPVVAKAQNTAAEPPAAATEDNDRITNGGAHESDDPLSESAQVTVGTHAGSYAHKTQVAAVPEYGSREQVRELRGIPTYSKISPSSASAEEESSAYFGSANDVSQKPRSRNVLSLLLVLALILFALSLLFLEQRVDVVRESGTLTLGHTSYRFGVPSLNISPKNLLSR